jgi:hypothetical protein
MFMVHLRGFSGKIPDMHCSLDSGVQAALEYVVTNTGFFKLMLVSGRPRSTVCAAGK